MKLTELNPKFIGFPDIKTGFIFDCPCCRKLRIKVDFKNPIDPQKWLEKGVSRHHYEFEWERTGETFENISLVPSVNYSHIGHWHGNITNGIISFS